MTSHCGFDVHFPNDEHLFTCSWPSALPLWKNIYLVLSKSGFSFFDVELYELFIYFGY